HEYFILISNTGMSIATGRHTSSDWNVFIFCSAYHINFCPFTSFYVKNRKKINSLGVQI
uniref:Uncharacterized protein n=1 Tax=Amphimedon queenslandica TaxID=400682 RepID=A0A1X7T0D5_AMPQE